MPQDGPSDGALAAAYQFLERQQMRDRYGETPRKGRRVALAQAPLLEREG